MRKPQRRVLAIDIGGSHVKTRVSGRREMRQFESDPTLTPRRMVARVLKLVGDLKYDVVSIGYPGIVVHGKIVTEPYNLGRGWVGFDFRKAFGRPTLVLNDAAMQAIGSYEGGRMLFLGLGTGLGRRSLSTVPSLPWSLPIYPSSVAAATKISWASAAVADSAPKNGVVWSPRWWSS